MTVTRLGHPEISSRPLLEQSREQSTGKTYEQAQEPKRVDPNGILWSSEGGSEEGTRDIRSTWVGNSLIDICEIEVGGVLWIRPKVLNRHQDQ